MLDLLSLDVPHIKGITGRYNLEEIERNLSARFPHLLPIYQKYLPFLKLEIVPIPPYEEIRPLLTRMSPKDVPVLVSARLGHADFLITGDKKGFPKTVAEPIRVLSPSEFLNNALPRFLTAWTEED